MQYLICYILPRPVQHSAFGVFRSSLTWQQRKPVGLVRPYGTDILLCTSVRSVTVYFRAMDGVAYTTGSRLDDDHKEIHFSTDYIMKIDEKRVSEEITGVLQHELVHCFQRDGKGSCPGGLVEGIAGESVTWSPRCCNQTDVSIPPLRQIGCVSRRVSRRRTGSARTHRVIGTAVTNARPSSWTGSSRHTGITSFAA